MIENQELVASDGICAETNAAGCQGLETSDGPVSEQRSRLMARVRQRDTKPEIAVRRAAHTMGFRFRLQRRDLPGRPDLVFPRLRKALFVHGCFWHSHPGCKWATVPKTRTEYWDAKLAANRERDARVEHEVAELGWDVGIVWECETRDADLLESRLREFLDRTLDYADETNNKADAVTTEGEIR